jgi:hypothetical protein
VGEELRAMPLTDNSSYVRSFVTGFGSYAVDVEASCHFLTNNRDTFLETQQAALLMIARVVGEQGAQFAVLFPQDEEERGNTGISTILPPFSDGRGPNVP